MLWGMPLPRLRQLSVLWNRFVSSRGWYLSDLQVQIKFNKFRGRVLQAVPIGKSGVKGQGGSEAISNGIPPAGLGVSTPSLSRCLGWPTADMRGPLHWPPSLVKGQGGLFTTFQPSGGFATFTYDMDTKRIKKQPIGKKSYLTEHLRLCHLAEALHQRFSTTVSPLAYINDQTMALSAMGVPHRQPKQGSPAVGSAPSRALPLTTTVSNIQTEPPTNITEPHRPKTEIDSKAEVSEGDDDSHSTTTLDNDIS